MKIWSSVSDWELVLPPSRPNAFQLDNIKNIIKNLPKKSNIAILGSTPEFRDLLFECGFYNIYIFDKSIDFFQKMSSQRIYNNSEVLITGDWVETLKKYDGHFDVILSDLTSGNVQYSKRKLFYKLIEKCLKKDGLFIDKYLTNEYGLLSLDEIENKYSHLPINLNTINDFSCEAIFCSELQEELQVVDTTQIYQLLYKRFSKNERIKKFVDLAHYITPDSCCWYYGKKKVYYIENLLLLHKFPLINTAYENRAWLYIWQKK